jgi:putative transposase
MVERPGVDLSVRRQCALLNLARSGVYRPKPVIGAGDLALRRRRIVAIELGICRSGWIGGASGSVTIGNGKFLEHRGGTRS